MTTNLTGSDSRAAQRRSPSAPDPHVTKPTPWHFDISFRIEIFDDADTTVVTFHGDLDALAAALLRRNAPIPIRHGTGVVLDLSALETIDMGGVQEIRRIQHQCNDVGSRAQVIGANGEVQALLNLSGHTQSERLMSSATVEPRSAPRKLA